MRRADRRDGDAGRDRLLDLPLESRHVHDLIAIAEQAVQDSDESGRVEGLRSALAIEEPESPQLDVGEMEAVHRYVRDPIVVRAVAEQGQQALDQGRLSGAGRPRDPQDGPSAVDNQRTGPVYELLHAAQTTPFVTRKQA